MTFWAVVIASGVATYLERSLPLVLGSRVTPPPALRRYLDGLPIAVIAALVGAGVAVPSGNVTHGAEVIGTLVALAVARRWRNLLVAALAGVAVVALLRGAGL